MTEKHKVRFEPVGIEIDVNEDQTILRAAAEQGIMLMHGCKEGQCASCKSFILEGDDRCVVAVAPTDGSSPRRLS